MLEPLDTNAESTDARAEVLNSHRPHRFQRHSQKFLRQVASVLSSFSARMGLQRRLLGERRMRLGCCCAFWLETGSDSLAAAGLPLFTAASI